MHADIEQSPFDVDFEDDSGQEYPWAPQPGETSLGFQAFTTYRDLGPKRSIAQVGRELGRDASILRQLSAKFNWVDRSLAFDAWLDRKSVEELARGRTQMRTEHVDLAVMARRKIAERFRNLDPNEMSVRDLAIWMDLCVKIERQGRGEPDKTVEVKGEINIIENLDAHARRNLMAEAQRVLAERLGNNVTAALEASILDADEVEEDDDAWPEQG